MQKSMIRVGLVTIAILLVPLIAMQFSNEVVWEFFDFVFIGALLFATGMTYEIVSKKFDNIYYRTAVAVSVLSTLLLIWVNAAAGAIGHEGNQINAMYWVVVLVGLVGAYFSKLEPRGLGKTMFAMAGAQIVVPVIAYLFFSSQIEERLSQVMGITVFFAALFMFSAILFRATPIEQKS